MFGGAYFGERYFGPTYWGPKGGEDAASVNIGGAGFVDEEERRRRRRKASRPRYEYPEDSVVQTYQIPEPQGEMVATVVGQADAKPMPGPDQAPTRLQPESTIIGLLDRRGVPIEAAEPEQYRQYQPIFPVVLPPWDEDEEAIAMLLLLT